MHWWIAVWLAAAPNPQAGNPAWGEFPRPTDAAVNPEPPVGSIERRAELDAMQAALGEWARERKETSRERERLRELRDERESLQAQSDEGSAPEVERGPAMHGGRHIEPKVIDIAPEPTHEQAEGWLEREVARHQTVASQSQPEASTPRREEDALTDTTAKALQRTLDQARSENVRARRSAGGASNQARKPRLEVRPAPSAAPDAGTRDEAPPTATDSSAYAPGTSLDGAAPDTAAPNRPAPDGAARDGTARDGTARDGTSPDGMSPESTAPDGTSPNGSSSSQDGASPDGTSRDGSSQDGSSPDVPRDPVNDGV